jgi:hypothetical protein
MELKDNITLLISTVALVFSYIAWRQKNTETERMIRSQIADIISKLISVEAEIRKLGARIDRKGAAPSLRSLRNTLTQQRDSLARQAHYLMQQSPMLVSDVDFAAVARALVVNDSNLADQYWRKAISASSGLVQGKHKRSYAMFLFERHERDKGRKQYEESIELLPPVSDIQRWERMWAYLNWARNEARTSLPKEQKSLEVSRLVRCARDTNDGADDDARRAEGLKVIEFEEGLLTKYLT